MPVRAWKTWKTRGLECRRFVPRNRAVAMLDMATFQSPTSNSYTPMNVRISTKSGNIKEILDDNYVSAQISILALAIVFLRRFAILFQFSVFPSRIKALNITHSTPNSRTTRKGNGSARMQWPFVPNLD